MKLQNLLVPTDFTPRCRAAADHALMIAERFSGSVTILHVIPGTPYQGTDDEHFYGPRGDVVTGRELDEFYRHRLEQWVAELSPTTPHSEVLLKGDAAGMIAEYVSAHDTDLVLVPTHGRGYFRKMLLGSVTAKILHDLDCPVLTSAHMEDHPERPVPYRHIACAVDLSPRAKDVLRAAAGLANQWDAKLTVIHATSPIGLVGPAPLPVQDEWTKQAVSRATTDAVELLHELSITDAGLEIGEGDPTAFTVATAERVGADVVVIGRGLAHQRSARLPTHAYGIIRQSPCPVISV